MNSSVVKILAFLLIYSCLPIWTLAATLRSIHVEWGYAPPSNPAVIGFNLYQEGELVCQTLRSDSTSMDCTIPFITEIANFTLTASFNDNTESPHSAPFPFKTTLNPSTLQGFDEVFYLGKKLANLQTDPKLAAEWAGAGIITLLNVLQQYGFTSESHYETNGFIEGLSPNAYFKSNQYELAKATAMFKKGGYTTVLNALVSFKKIWPGDVYKHYLSYGDNENINPSNDFDVSIYLEKKLLQLKNNPETASRYNSVADVRAAFRAAGLTTLGHFLRYGIQEGLTAYAVPAAEQVHP